MTEHRDRATAEGGRRPAGTPEQHAALHELGGEEGKPQGYTENTTFDTDQHSDAPGPFGTG
jgi:phage gpG-like protein